MRFEIASAVLVVVFLLSNQIVPCSGFYIPLSIEELTDKADVILIGTVEEVLHSSAPKMFRQVTVLVERYLKNPLETETVTVVARGVTIGNMTLWVEDQPEFQESERVLLFLRDDPTFLFENPQGFYEVVGMVQGKFNVGSDNAVSDSGQLIEDGLRIGEIKFVIGPPIVLAIPIISDLEASPFTHTTSEHPEPIPHANENKLGDNVTIRFVVTNTLNQSQVYIIPLQIENETITISVELEPLQSKRVSYTLTPEIVGFYRVSVDGLTDAFYLWPLDPLVPPADIAVREGDWVEYSFSFYRESPDTFGRVSETKILIQDYDFETTVRILDVTGTNMTFEEERRFLNGSITRQITITGNPNEPHYQHPLYRINDLFIPAGLKAGDYVPQTLAFLDSQDNVVQMPWAQYINETLEKIFLGVKREVNHIYWKRHIRGNTSNGKSTFDYYQERDGYYDKSTGVMLQWFYNYSKIYRRVDTGEESVLRGIYDYKVSDTNLWSVPLWVRREVQIATTTILSLIVVLVTIWIKRDWLFERIGGVANG